MSLLLPEQLMTMKPSVMKISRWTVGNPLPEALDPLERWWCVSPVGVL